MSLKLALNRLIHSEFLILIGLRARKRALSSNSINEINSSDLISFYLLGRSKMSLLNSFKWDFNRQIEIWKYEVKKNKLWETVSEFSSDIKKHPCLVMLNDVKYNQIVGSPGTSPGKVEYLLASHKIRLEFGPIIKIWDKLKDNTGQRYRVEYVYTTPGFGGVDDHLLLYVEAIND